MYTKQQAKLKRKFTISDDAVCIVTRIQFLMSVFTLNCFLEWNFIFSLSFGLLNIEVGQRGHRRQTIDD